jgi:hypothetical protein
MPRAAKTRQRDSEKKGVKKKGCECCGMARALGAAGGER